MPVQPVQWKHSVNAVDIAVWEWPGADPAIFFCHATGFHGRCWDQIVARLKGRHCFAIDVRGHGRSTKPAPPYHWRNFGRDVGELTAILGIEHALAVGHSMGGHSVTFAASLAPQAFAKLLLLDPVILPEIAYQGAMEPLDFVLRRRNLWDSADQMFDRFESRPPFDAWDRAVLRDYCDFALRGSVLACPPEVEASIYAQSTEQQSNIYPEIAALDLPVHVVRSRDPYTYGRFDGCPTAPNLAARFPHATDQYLNHVSHFIPMEVPDLTTELILKLS